MLLSPEEIDDIVLRRTICLKKIRIWKEQQIITEQTEMKIHKFSTLVYEYDMILRNSKTFINSQFSQILLQQHLKKINKLEDSVIRATAPSPPPTPPVPFVKKVWRTVSGRVRRAFAKRRRVLGERVQQKL